MKAQTKRTPRVDHVVQVANELEQAILSGKLAAGDKLPSERDISAQMKVSRSVVREALRRLASLGLIRAEHGSGTRVEAPNSKLLTTGYEHLLRRLDCHFESLGVVRLPLETTIAGLAAQNRGDDHIARLDKTQEVLASPRRSFETHIKADLAFHAALADATGNPIFHIVLEPIQALLFESRRRTIGKYGVEIVHQHHARILRAVVKRDSAAAAEAMREHIEANMRHLKSHAPDASRP